MGKVSKAKRRRNWVGGGENKKFHKKMKLGEIFLGKGRG